MKRKWSLFGVAIGGVGLAAPFENLNFDEGAIPSDGRLRQPTELVLPGWSAWLGESQLEEIEYLNDFSPPYGYVSVQEANIPAFEGRYGLRLAGGSKFPATSPSLPATIRQVGDVPVGSQSLLFQGVIKEGTFQVSIDGTVVPYYEKSRTPEIAIYAVDVRGFSGREMELSLSGFASSDGFGGGGLIDSLSFSPLPAVPEPSTWALLGLGAVALLREMRRQRDAGRD